MHVFVPPTKMAICLSCYIHIRTSLLDSIKQPFLLQSEKETNIPGWRNNPRVTRKENDLAFTSDLFFRVAGNYNRAWHRRVINNPSRTRGINEVNSRASFIITRPTFWIPRQKNQWYILENDAKNKKVRNRHEEDEKRGLSPSSRRRSLYEC